VEVVDPVTGLVHGDVLDVVVGGVGPEEAWPYVGLEVVGDPEGLLEGEQVVAGGEDSGDLGDVCVNTHPPKWRASRLDDARACRG
jgi:hypothetical protein